MVVIVVRDARSALDMKLKRHGKNRSVMAISIDFTANINKEINM
jgi:hypothetical protein